MIPFLLIIIIIITLSLSLSLSRSLSFSFPEKKRVNDLASILGNFAHVKAPSESQFGVILQLLLLLWLLCSSASYLPACVGTLSSGGIKRSLSLCSNICIRRLRGKVRKTSLLIWRFVNRKRREYWYELQRYVRLTWRDVHTILPSITLKEFSVMMMPVAALVVAPGCCAGIH